MTVFETHIHGDHDSTHYYCPACWSGYLCDECKARWEAAKASDDTDAADDE